MRSIGELIMYQLESSCVRRGESQQCIVARSILMALAFCLPPVVFAQSENDVDLNEPPLAGQPEFFDGAVGSFRVIMRATPTDLQPDEALTLTVRITALSPVLHPPRRPDLRNRPEFAARFHIDRTRDTSPRELPTERSWEFDYRLRPKSPSVREVPPLRFDYFRPGFVPIEAGYQTSWAYALPLHIEARETRADSADAPIQPSDAFFQVSIDQSLLARHGSTSISTWALSGWLLAAPLLCTLWYGYWRWRFPDAEQRARQRRSSAARRALADLRSAHKDRLQVQPRRSAEAVTRYLHQRFDLAFATPTSHDISDFLLAHGCTPALASRTADLFRAVDRARYAPNAPQHSDWIAEASDLILALEAVPCQVLFS
jgi:hypothetical protein